MFYYIQNMSCPICIEKFNASSRKQVICLKCSTPCCRGCAQRYLLELASTPHCMKCKHAWDIKFMMDNLTKTFVNKKYKDRRKQLLFDIEKSRIPSSMPAVSRFIEVDKLRQENKRLLVQKRQLSNLIRDINGKMWANQHKIRYGKEITINKKFTQPCPISTCKGFLSTAWKCQVCKTNICAQCREIKEEEHVCNEDTVKTVQLLKKDTKPCPSCGEGIYKISGCDQMWCTQCKVPFSWRTGCVVTGTVHNPHYYQFLRNNKGQVPRTPGDVQCGGMPGVSGISYQIQANEHLKNAPIEIDGVAYKLRDHIFILHRNLCHFRRINIPRIRNKTRTNNDNNRILYILNRIDEKKFKSHLAKNDTALRKNTDIYNIYHLIDTVCTEQFIIMARDINKIFECMRVIDQLRLYANGELKKLRDTYKHKIPEFNYRFQLVNP